MVGIMCIYYCLFIIFILMKLEVGWFNWNCVVCVFVIEVGELIILFGSGGNDWVYCCDVKKFNF